MKRHRIYPVVLLLLGGLGGACSGEAPGGGETIGSAAQAITVPSRTPQPNNWSKGFVELLVADALTACSFVEQNGQDVLRGLDPVTNDDLLNLLASSGDNYLYSVSAAMNDAWCGPTYPTTPSVPDTSRLAHWYFQRQDTTCNKRADTTDQSLPQTIQISPDPLPQTITAGVGPIPAAPTNVSYNRNVATANHIVRMPLLNLCIARELRARAPGTAGGEQLLLSAPDQRELLEVTRERVQMAMLEFGNLAVAFTSPTTFTTPSSFTSDTPLPLVAAWAQGQGPAPQTLLQQMGEQFASAVQLHAVVAQEIADLFARSSSAREPRGGHAATIADETWGPGSWRQRTLASLFGGAPLATDLDGSTPWTGDLYSNWIGQSPNNTDPSDPYGLGQWPSSYLEPYFHADLSYPEAQRLLSLARAYDTVDVAPGGTIDTDCAAVDRATTAQWLYMHTERALEGAECAHPHCDTPLACQPYWGTFEYAGCRLYIEHGITPDHATLAASYLGDLLEPFCSAPGSWHFGSGARNLSQGSISASPWSTGALHLSKDAQFMERGPEQIQPMYGRYGTFYSSPTPAPTSSADSQGFDDWNPFGGQLVGIPPSEGKRNAGTVPALVATREALLDAENSVLYYANGTSYFDEKDRMLAVINGAVGTDSVVIRPLLQGAAGGDASVSGGSGALYWTVSVTRSTSDPVWSGVPAQGCPLYAILDDPQAAILVAHPSTSILGRSAASVIPTMTSFSLSRTTASSVSSAPTLTRFSGSFSVQPESFNLFHTSATPHLVTLVAQVGTQYVVLAANVPLRNPVLVAQGFYLAQGGSLTTFAERLLYGQPSNPAKPAFDGFGLPTSWVPPTDPTLFGAASGQDAAAYYLAQAQQAGQEATAAVQQAFTDLDQQAVDGAAAAVAQAKSQTIIDQQAQALCGDNNPGCDTHINTIPVLAQTSAPPSCNAASTNPTDIVNCIAAGLLASATASFPIADAVASVMNAPSPPAFANYAGGSLQAMFIQQWGAVQQVNDQAAEVNAGVAAAIAAINAAQQVDWTAHQQAQTDCSAERMATALAAGTSVSGGFPSGVSASLSMGPMIAQLNKCMDETNGLAAADAQKVAAVENSILAMTDHASQMHDAVEKLAELSSDIQLAVSNAARATAQAQQDAVLATVAQSSSLSIYRDYSSYDLWRAQAMVDNARRYAVAARRAIETKFLVDLSTMNADEAFVAAPSTWADSVYDYDLSLPAAVGLTVGTPDTSGVYPNKIADYVGNLQSFVNGYAVSRPTAIATGDSDVITLLGPDTSLPLPGTEGPSPSSSQQDAWSYHCASLSKWVQIPHDPTTGLALPASQACSAAGGAQGEAPTGARLVFSIDAWGRPNAYGVQAPPTQRFNTRWSRLAVNLVGTGIKDCSKAADPLGCYSSSFVSYNLTHTGPSWITDFEGDWRLLSVPLGQIEQGKALAAEQWLDPISNGWSEPYVQAVQRVEFTGRPLDGTYQLELVVAPEVQLDKIERIQILSDTSYWVRQQ